MTKSRTELRRKLKNELISRCLYMLEHHNTFTNDYSRQARISNLTIHQDEKRGIGIHMDVGRDDLLMIWSSRTPVEDKETFNEKLLRKEVLPVLRRFMILDDLANT